MTGSDRELLPCHPDDTSLKLRHFEGKIKRYAVPKVEVQADTEQCQVNL